MVNKNNQIGYSLVEVLIATVFVLAVFAGFGTFLMKFLNTSEELIENSSQKKDTLFSTKTIRQDIESLGLHLTSKSSEVAGVFAPNFLPNDSFEVSKNSIYKTSSVINPLVTDFSFKGKAEIKGEGAQFTVGIVDYESSFKHLELQRIDGGNGSHIIKIVENGQTVETINRQGESGETKFSLQITTVGTGEGTDCLGRIYIGEELLYQTARSCSDKHTRFYVDCPESNYINNLVVVITDGKSANSSNVKLPLLPLHLGQRMLLPFVSTQNRVLIIAGDERFYLDESQYFLDNSTKKLVKLNTNSDISNGDVLFAMDYLNDKSLLLRVEAALGNNEYEVIPIENDNQSLEFENIYSDIDDYHSHTFEKGTRIVRMSTPIEYKTEPEQDGSTHLYRRHDGYWQPVIKDISDFVAEVKATENKISISISFAGLTNEMKESVLISVNPVAINAGFDVR